MSFILNWLTSNPKEKFFSWNAIVPKTYLLSRTEFSLILSVDEMSFITEIVVENEKLKLALQR